MKTTLIIPDLHHKVDQATKIMKCVKHDEVILLGDAFDDFGDNPEMVLYTCRWVNDFLTDSTHIFIGGNHDIQYMYPYRTFQCSGYAQWKYFIIHDNVPAENWAKLKWYHFLDGKWFMAHGGLHKDNLPESIAKLHTDRPKFIKEISDYLDHHIQEGFRAGATGQRSWVFNAGRARWGSQKVGGLTWCDFEREFKPIKGLNQIVGHTPQMQGPRWLRVTQDDKTYHHPYDMFTPTLEQLDNPELSFNIDLDVHGNTHYAVWDGKKLEVGNYADL